MMNLAELHSYLTESADVQSLLKDLAKEYHNRNLALYSDAAIPYNSKATEPDSLETDYNSAIELISSQLLQTDLTTLISAEDGEFYYNTLWYSQKEDGSINIEPAARMVIGYLLRTYVPGIDEYITSLEDYSLPKHLSIQVDDEGLVTIDRNMDLRRHALVLSSQQIMVYPHQFLRRFYSANFVNILSKLEQCRQNGMKVKLRIDPLRVTHPQYYTEFIEEDYWYGKKFSASLLQSKDPKPVRTLHRTPEGEHHFIYPVDFTVFRSDMMSSTERQFIIEEYVPLTNPVQSTRCIHGVGKLHCIQKFAHFVYDQEQQAISHIDGAVRTFTIDDYAEALAIVAGGSEPGKRLGTRHKLFKVEGSISLEQVQSLLYEFFMYNSHISEYFSNTVLAQTTT